MKESQKWQKLITTVAVGTLTIAALSSGEAQVMAQDAVLPPPPPGMEYVLTANGSYSMVPVGTAQVVMAGSGGFHAADGSGPPSLPSGSGGGGESPQISPQAPGTNLFLYITQVPESNVCLISATNTSPGQSYILEQATWLDGPWGTNQGFVGAAGTNVTVLPPIPIVSVQGMFFRALEGETSGPRWRVQLVNTANALLQDASGPGLDTSPALSPNVLYLYTNGAFWGVEPVYMSTATGTLWSVDLFTGSVLWTNTLFTPEAVEEAGVQQAEFTGSAVVSPDGSRVYVGTILGNLFCFNATNGGVIWSNTVGSSAAIYATPALDASGRILVGADEAYAGRINSPITGLGCYDAATGSTNWFFQPQDLFYGNAGDIDGSVDVDANGNSYFLTEGYRMYCVSSNGNLLWFLPVPGDLEPDSSVSIGVSNGRALLYSGSDSSYIYAVHGDGSLQFIYDTWTTYPYYNNLTDIQCSPSLGNGAIYCGSGASVDDAPYGTLTYLAAQSLYSLGADFQANWIFDGPQGVDAPLYPPTIGTPAVGANAIYMPCYDGNVYAVTNGAEAAVYSPGGPVLGGPVIGPEWGLVFGSEDGNLYCYPALGGPATNAPWPVFHGDGARSGLQTNAVENLTDNGAPFVFNGDNDGNGHFFFSMTGTPGASNLCVYTSTNLASTNWTLLATNISLDPTTGNAYFTNDVAEGTAAEFYVVSRSNSNSRVIGFVSNSVPPGKSLAADQLCQVDDGVLYAYEIVNAVPMNTLNALFTVSNAWTSAQAGAAISKWNGTSFNSVTNVGPQIPVWSSSSALATSPGDLTMLPGEGEFISNPTDTPFPIWFNGLVRDEQVFQVSPGTNEFSTNFFSATVPEIGYITEITGYVPGEGDMVQLWTNQAFLSYHYASGAWFTNGVASAAPSVGVGEGFVLITSNAYTWTNSWQPSPP